MSRSLMTTSMQAENPLRNNGRNREKSHPSAGTSQDDKSFCRERGYLKILCSVNFKASTSNFDAMGIRATFPRRRWPRRRGSLGAVACMEDRRPVAMLWLPQRFSRPDWRSCRGWSDLAQRADEWLRGAPRADHSREASNAADSRKAMFRLWQYSHCGAHHERDQRLSFGRWPSAVI